MSHAGGNPLIENANGGKLSGVDSLSRIIMLINRTASTWISTTDHIGAITNLARNYKALHTLEAS